MMPGDAELRSMVQDLGEAVEEVADTLEAVGADLQELESRVPTVDRLLEATADRARLERLETRVLGEGVDPMEPHFSLRDRVQVLERGLRRIRRYLEELEDPESGDGKLPRDLWKRVAELEERVSSIDANRARLRVLGGRQREEEQLRRQLSDRVHRLETGGTS